MLDGCGVEAEPRDEQQADQLCGQEQPDQRTQDANRVHQDEP